MNKKIPFKPESVLYFGPFEVTSSSMRSPGCFPTVWKKVRGCRALVSICWLLCRHSADQLIPDPLNGCRWGGGGGPGHVTQSLSLVKLGLRNLEVCLGSTSCCPPIPPTHSHSSMRHGGNITHGNHPLTFSASSKDATGTKDLNWTFHGFDIQSFSRLLVLSE